MSVERSSRRKSADALGPLEVERDAELVEVAGVEGRVAVPAAARRRAVLQGGEDRHLVAAAPGVGPAARLDLDHLRAEQRELLRAVRARPDLRQRERPQPLQRPRARGGGRHGRVPLAFLAVQRGAIGAGGVRGPAQPGRRRRERAAGPACAVRRPPAARRSRARRGARSPQSRRRPAPARRPRARWSAPRTVRASRAPRPAPAPRAPTPPRGPGGRRGSRNVRPRPAPVARGRAAPAGRSRCGRA